MFFSHNVQIQILNRTDGATMDMRMDRVRIIHDDDNKVVMAPCVG